jgi:hypothetical protein
MDEKPETRSVIVVLLSRMFEGVCPSSLLHATVGRPARRISCLQQTNGSYRGNEHSSQHCSITVLEQRAPAEGQTHNANRGEQENVDYGDDPQEAYVWPVSIVHALPLGLPAISAPCRVIGY